jgi:hypothetical protein
MQRRLNVLVAIQVIETWYVKIKPGYLEQVKRMTASDIREFGSLQSVDVDYIETINEEGSNEDEQPAS